VKSSLLSNEVFGALSALIPNLPERCTKLVITLEVDAPAIVDATYYAGLADDPDKKIKERFTLTRHEAVRDVTTLASTAREFALIDNPPSAQIEREAARTRDRTNEASQ
jgi:hypothetical protein